MCAQAYLFVRQNVGGWWFARAHALHVALECVKQKPCRRLETDFERRFKFFFTVLSAKKQQVVLSGLLLRLDYNGYVSQRDLPSF